MSVREATADATKTDVPEQDQPREPIKAPLVIEIFGGRQIRLTRPNFNVAHRRRLACPTLVRPSVGRATITEMRHLSKHRVQPSVLVVGTQCATEIPQLDSIDDARGFRVMEGDGGMVSVF